MANAPAGRIYPDKGWAENGFYRCLGFGCGWGGWPFKGAACPLCGAVVPGKSMTQARWRRGVYETGRYRPAVSVEAQ